MKKNKALAISVGTVLAALCMSSCEHVVYSEGNLSSSKIELREDTHFEDVDVHSLSDADIASMVQHYQNNGEGQVALSVTYDPHSSSNTAMHATSHAARLAEKFRKNGVSDVKTSIIPVKDSGNVTRALVSFDAYTISAPDDCTTMAGYHDRVVDVDEDYKFGCTRDTILTKQIANPRDLAGRSETLDTSDGRRAANVVDRYRSGVPNDELGGESASQ